MADLEVAPFTPARARSTRLGGDYMQMITTGPWQETGLACAPQAGEYLLGRTDVRGGLSDLTNLAIRVSTGATTGTAFFVFYEVTADGLPGRLIHATAAFALTGGAGTKTVAAGAIASAVQPGEYYAGMYFPNDVTGTPGVIGARTARMYVLDIINHGRTGLQLLEAVPGTAPASDLSAVTINGGANNFAYISEPVPALFGT